MVYDLTRRRPDPLMKQNAPQARLIEQNAPQARFLIDF